LHEALQKLSQQLKQKTKETNDFAAKYKIQVKSQSELASEGKREKSQGGAGVLV
jgi:hypothetical protein